jgi:hypothetical protein
MKIILALVFASTMLSGCSLVTTNFSNTGTNKLSSLNENCEFNVYATPPKSEYAELGVVEIDVAFYGFIPPIPNIKTVSSIKKRVQPYVCQAGGNGVLLWEANGGGEYRKIIVVKTSEI